MVVPSGTIPLSGPDITEREIELVNQVLQTPYLSMGPMIERFEAAVADFVGARHAVAVSSGTAGLHLAMVAAGLCPGDEVITTPFSFVASANCALYVGATPRFADIEAMTLNLDPDQVEAAITPRTRALLPVHVFGQPCAMDRLMGIAQKHDLVVVEDACEAIGAEFKEQAVGTFGACGVFAFYPNKQMTTGEGGMLVTDDEAWAALFRSLRNQGRDESGTWLRHVRLGYNYRMPELSAALGVAQMERIKELLAKREQVANWYTERLNGMDGVQVPWVAPEVTRMSWFVYVVRLAPELDRDKIMVELARRGVPARPYFTPLHLQPLYRERFGFCEGDFPITEQVARSTLALPFSGRMGEGKVERVCRTLGCVVRGVSKPHL
ncbi:MAG: DegT/DnrJ/EryC1/StrS family aminotransferase [Anaerolineae bacterium]